MQLAKFGFFVGSILIVSFTLCAQDKGAPAKGPQTKEEIIKEAPPLAPRATPGDYQAHRQVGAVTLAAEFAGHSVPTPQAVFNSEEYVVVEAAMFGAPDTKLDLSTSDFTLRINGKKPLASQAFITMARTLKDPEWIPPESGEAKQSKTSIGGSGGNAMDPAVPAVVHMPMALRHTMELRTQKASMPEGERVLPQAGLLYFQYRGKTENIQSIELTYAGAAGTITLALQP